MEIDGNEFNLCAIPKDLDQQLFNDLWNKGIPIILTSGTLSAGGDFSHIKRTLGLGYTGVRLTETSKPSPFDYHEHSILYISENIPFPDQRDKEYISAITDEIERLIIASHGHAAVLFTSYNAMGLVYTALKRRKIPFPLFRLDKGGVREIERFKRSGNGVLFASGALWEGIDIPGDALSMLIIVKLPFQVPDPIGEYERTLYGSMDEYIRKVIVPEMLIKLKQGFGRLIRNETDTGVVAILDCRVNKRGAYRQRVLDALPDCYVTDEIGDVEDFTRAAKGLEYFE
jgi:ATP-dependent DNA helicase DinG